MKSIRIATTGTPSDYRSGLVPIIAQSLGYTVVWSTLKDADLEIIGAFAPEPAKPLRWCPKPLRPLLAKTMVSAPSKPERRMRPLRLFHTFENLRHNHREADYTLSFDLAVDSTQHLRHPYWMEMIDWSHEGIIGNTNPRFGALLTIERLQRPLGVNFLSRERRALFFTSHLREPRATLLEALERILPVDKCGPYFDSSIVDHHQSGFTKLERLQTVGFNLCPENGMFPGYYTEKIPEAFFAGTLPITWCDNNVAVDFNPRAILNLAPMMRTRFAELAPLLTDPKALAPFADEALLTHTPSIEPLRQFMARVLADATS
jgi:hypothetical protein